MNGEGEDDAWGGAGDTKDAAAGIEKGGKWQIVSCDNDPKRAVQELKAEVARHRAIQGEDAVGGQQVTARV